MDWIRSWVEQSPYSVALGVKLVSLTETVCRLTLPYQDANSNPGQALHGGCAASLGIIGAQAVARANLGQEAGPFHTAGVQVNYLAAAIGEEIHADATLLRRGKNLCFAEVDVATGEGKSIAHVTAVVRGRFGADPVALRNSAGDHGRAEPGPMGPHIGRLPFTQERGLVVEHMTDSTSRIRMPISDKNRDGDGGFHEGALLALLDTTGAMASWADTGPGPYKASTPAMQAQILAPPPREDLVAYGHVVQRDGDGFWSDVEVAGQESGLVIARGTVLYRIVT